MWDAETGGALLVIDVGVGRESAGVLCRPGDGRAAARCCTGCRLDEKVRIFDAVAGGEALLVIEVGSLCVRAGVLHGPGDGRAAARLWL